MTEHTITSTFTATVTYWNRETKSGFAEGCDERVPIDLSTNRETNPFVPGDPVLTDRPSDRQPNWHDGRRTETILVKTAKDSRGKTLEVIAWGFMPARTWLEELLYSHELDAFAGGHVEIGYSEQYDADYFDEKSRGKLTAAPWLTTDPWTLHLSYDAYDGALQEYDPPTGQKELTFSLNDGERLPSSLPYGRYALDVHIPNQDRWAHIVFYPSGQWIGR